MRIAFDFQAFIMQRHGGISRYFVKIAEEMALAGENPRIFAPLHSNEYLKQASSNLASGWGIDGHSPRLNRFVHFVNFHVAKAGISRWKPDILHETYYQRNRSVPGVPSVVTVYDMIHELFDHYSLDETLYLKKKAVERADHVICISHNTKADLMSILGTPEEKISVTHLAYERLQNAGASDRGRSKLEKPFLLHVGYRSGYKNFEGVLRAVAASPELKDNFDVIGFGGGPFSTEEQQMIAGLGFRDGQVKQIGGNDEMLGLLYTDAAVFVYPSLYEGFGLPPLEAMAHDCPVVCSNTSSMPEVVRDAAEMFDPSDLDAMRHAIERIAFDSERRADLVKRGRERLNHFSWKRCAEETLAIYRSVLG